jgi:hypothetical protein
LFAPHQFFELLAQIEQQMKFVGNLLRLRCSFAGGGRIVSSAVAADHFNFRVGQQPGFDRLLSAVWQNLDRAPELEINQ